MKLLPDTVSWLWQNPLLAGCHGSSEPETFILEISSTTNKGQVCTQGCVLACLNLSLITLSFLCYSLPGAQCYNKYMRANFLWIYFAFQMVSSTLEVLCCWIDIAGFSVMTVADCSSEDYLVDECLTWSLFSSFGWWDAFKFHRNMKNPVNNCWRNQYVQWLITCYYYGFKSITGNVRISPKNTWKFHYVFYNCFSWERVFFSWKANEKFSLIIIINAHCNIIVDVFPLCCRNLKNFLLKRHLAVTDLQKFSLMKCTLLYWCSVWQEKGIQILISLWMVL